MIQIDNTSKGMFINEIINEGFDVIVKVLSDGLTEIPAPKLKAEMISAFGTEGNRVILKNSVTPSGSVKRKYSQVNFLHGVYEKAQLGLNFLKTSTLELIKASPEGILYDKKG